jgi:Glycosyl hydrolase family 79 C-terminal beta domain
MNHTSNINSVSDLISVKNALFPANSSSKSGHIPFILGETNSLYNEGKPGLSNAFGAALWGFDFALYCASQGIQRVHMHQGTDYRYASWQPIATDKTSIGTKAPYYGNIAVAAFLGDLTAGYDVNVVNLPLAGDSQQAAYAAYAGGHLARVAAVNLRQYNYTVNGTLSVPNPVARPKRSYTFAVPGWSDGEKVCVQRLLANGSDAVSGITWDGWSYNYELDHGRPVRLHNVTVGEEIVVTGGVVTLNVLDSSIAVLQFGCVGSDEAVRT